MTEADYMIFIVLLSIWFFLSGIAWTKAIKYFADIEGLIFVFPTGVVYIGITVILFDRLKTGLVNG